MKHHDPTAIRRAKIIRTIVMVLLCIISLLPFYLMFVNGTRTSNEHPPWAFTVCFYILLRYAILYAILYTILPA